MYIKVDEFLLEWFAGKNKKAIEKIAVDTQEYHRKFIEEELLVQDQLFRDQVLYGVSYSYQDNGRTVRIDPLTVIPKEYLYIKELDVDE